MGPSLWLFASALATDATVEAVQGTPPTAVLASFVPAPPPPEPQDVVKAVPTPPAPPPVVAPTPPTIAPSTPIQKLDPTDFQGFIHCEEWTFILDRSGRYATNFKLHENAHWTSDDDLVIHLWLEGEEWFRIEMWEDGNHCELL